MLYVKSLIVWLSFGVVAVSFGVAREKILVPRIGELRGHQIGTLAVCAFIAVIIIAAMRWLRPTSRQALAVGLFWVVLTVLFEVVVFHYLFGAPWDKLMADYNMAAGRLWPLVLVTQLVCPWMVVSVEP